MRRFAAVVLPLALLLAACAGGPGTPDPGDVDPDRYRERRAGSAPSPAPGASSPTAGRPRDVEVRSSPPRAPAAQRALDRRLRRAAWADDVTRARRLVRRGADVDARDGTGQSAYLISASEGHLRLLRLTLRHGARVADTDGWDGTALIRAAERGHATVVGELLRAGVAPDHVNRLGYSAIHEAVWLGEDTAAYAATVRVLAAGGARLGLRSPSAGLTPLEMARERGLDRLERTLDAVSAPPHRADPDAALLRAAGRGDADAVAVALRAGADLEARDEHDRTALLLAAAADHVPVAELLVALGADPDALDDRHDTPWLVTGVTGSVAMLEALLPANPDLTIRNRFGGLSPIPASERGHVDYVRRVVRTGVDLDHVNDLGWTALLEAVILGDGGVDHQEVVRLLLAAGADPTVADRDGTTPLEHARRRGYDEIAELLRRG